MAWRATSRLAESVRKPECAVDIPKQCGRRHTREFSDFSSHVRLVCVTCERRQLAQPCPTIEPGHRQQPLKPKDSLEQLRAVACSRE